MNRRDFYKKLGLLGMAVSTTPLACNMIKEENEKDVFPIPEALSKKMYARALEITKQKIRGGHSETYFKKPFIDAAFSPNIFLWDTCFMVCFAKYHTDELPVYQALDNFYDQMEDDGFICREYTQNGQALWSKDHPVSINPPLLAFAEMELFSVTQNIKRLKKVYPMLKKNFQFHVDRYQGDDKLFWGDTLGMGMDNLARYPKNWKSNEGNGLTHHELAEELSKTAQIGGPEWVANFVKEYENTLQGKWNKQGRLVDFTSQMALYSISLKKIASLIQQNSDIPYYEKFHSEVKTALNLKCWNTEDRFYYDLGFDKHLKRKHIGMYWALLGELVDDDKLDSFLDHLTNPDEFYREMPLPSLSADDPDYKGWGDYWLGGVWPPTTYMVLKGLTVYNKHELAKKLAIKTYKNVAKVFEATNTFWENYAPDLVSYGLPSKKDFCGWTALIPISVYKEYIKK